MNALAIEQTPLHRVFHSLCRFATYQHSELGMDVRYLRGFENIAESMKTGYATFCSDRETFEGSGAHG
jgi:hypothetical protein